MDHIQGRAGRGRDGGDAARAVDGAPGRDSMEEWAAAATELAMAGPGGALVAGFESMQAVPDQPPEKIVLGGLPGEAPASRAQPGHLRVMTINIHKGFTALNRKFALPELREASRAAGADILFLQEVVGAPRAGSRHEGRASDAQYEFLAEAVWSQSAYGANAFRSEGHHGNAILSKLPILRHENRDISISGPERRGALLCVVELPDGREAHLICAHLGLREPHRVQQLRMIAAMVRDEIPADALVVLAGDFNDWRGSAHGILLREAGLREVFVDAHGKPARTFPARFPLLRLDRVYVKNARSASPLPLPKGPWSHLSDHAPLAADIEWGRLVKAEEPARAGS